MVLSTLMWSILVHVKQTLNLCIDHISPFSEFVFANNNTNLNIFVVAGENLVREFY